jgi:hypothetical protein
MQYRLLDVSRTPQARADAMDRPALMTLWTGIALSLEIEGWDTSARIAVTLIIARDVHMPLWCSRVQLVPLVDHSLGVSNRHIVCTVYAHPVQLIELPLRAVLSSIMEYATMVYERAGGQWTDRGLPGWTGQVLW